MKKMTILMAAAPAAFCVSFGVPFEYMKFNYDINTQSMDVV